VIGAHVLFCESLDNPLKKENPPLEKYKNIVTSQNDLFYLMGNLTSMSIWDRRIEFFLMEAV
jgi:hypothetical protein